MDCGPSRCRRDGYGDKVAEDAFEPLFVNPHQGRRKAVDGHVDAGLRGLYPSPFNAQVQRLPRVDKLLLRRVGSPSIWA